MTESARIKKQLETALGGDAWHGPSLYGLLEGMDAVQAAARPAESVHSVWEIVLHLTSTCDTVCRRLDGERFSPTDEEDWPRVWNTHERAWQKTAGRLRESHERLAAKVGQLDDAALDRPIVEGYSTIYVTLHGVIQHVSYHAGQIALIRKIATAKAY